ncbi:unnamed protein product, partial [Effrenium voratum]
SGTALITDHAMYQRVPTNEFFDAAPEPRCCSTRGVTFNFLVGVVVCANALLLGIEADLGLLGPAGPKWTGFETDVLSMHAVGNELEKGIESEIKSGIKADRIIKDDLRYKVNETIHKDIAFNSELALPSGGQLKYAAYTVCEYFFVLFYLLEMFLRMCDLGCRNYCCKYAWMPLDLAVVTTGLLDLSLPFFLEDDLERMSVLPFLRLLRVLRLLKLFQICQPLRIIGRGVVKAFAVVVLVGMVVLVLNFGLSVILTTLVGQRSMLWADETTEDIATWFGSIGRSMQTLFTIQTLAGWDNIANVLGTVYPSTVVVPLIVLYMMVCVFAVVGLITSVISDSFMASQQRELKSRELSKEKRRALEADLPHRFREILREELQELRQQVAADAATASSASVSVSPKRPTFAFSANIGTRRSFPGSDEREELQHCRLLSSVSDKHLDLRAASASVETPSIQEEERGKQVAPSTALRQENLQLREQLLALREQAVEAKEREKAKRQSHSPPNLQRSERRESRGVRLESGASLMNFVGLGGPTA